VLTLVYVTLDIQLQIAPYIHQSFRFASVEMAQLHVPEMELALRPILVLAMLDTLEIFANFQSVLVSQQMIQLFAREEVTAQLQIPA
jgi:hypothetical protein